MNGRRIWALLLVAMLVACAPGAPPPSRGLLASGGWCWDWVADADRYDLLAALRDGAWGVWASVPQNGSATEPACLSYDHEPAGGLVFFVVVACNANGCSSTEHGGSPGEGYDPS